MYVVMKRLLPILLMVASTMTFAAKDGAADSCSNVLSISVLPCNDLKRIPIQVGLRNELPITCVQCYISTPDTTDLFLRNEGEQDNLACTPSERWASNHHTMIKWAPKSDPYTAMVIVVSSTSENFAGNEGAIFTIYFDGSKLGEGEHKVKMIKGNVAWTDHKTIKTFYTPDTEATFTIKRGKVVAPKGSDKKK